MTRWFFLTLFLTCALFVHFFEKNEVFQRKTGGFWETTKLVAGPVLGHKQVPGLSDIVRFGSHGDCTSQTRQKKSQAGNRKF